MNTFRRSIRLQKGGIVCSNAVKRYMAQDHGFAASLTKKDEDETQLSTKYKRLSRLPCKPPFVKSLFHGKFDTDMLAFPEFLDADRLKLLDENVAVVRKLCSEEIFSKDIDESRAIPEDVIKRLKELRIFGLSAKRSLGGAEFTNTERARIYEILSSDSNVPAMLFNHETLGHKLISRYGNDFQRDTYLKKLISAEIFSANCFGEAEAGSDASHFETYALRVGEDYMLSGTKVWVMNADKADLFIVFAKVRLTSEEGKVNIYYGVDGNAHIIPEDIGVFLVEKTPSIQVGPRKETTGLRGVSFHDVKFDETVVPSSHVLSNFKQGYQIVKDFMTEDRFLLGTLPLGILKMAQEDMIDYSIRRKLHGSNLFNYGMTQSKISKVVVAAYAIESMLYYTAGLIDMYDGQDVEVESAIVKVFSSEKGFEAINEAILMMGSSALLESSTFYRYFRDMRFMALLDAPNDMYKCLIALNGLQYVSNEYADSVIKMRNPLFFPIESMRSFLNVRLGNLEDNENPTLHLKLKEFLHPSLQYVADEIERCVLRFELGVKAVLCRVGPSSVNDQFILKRLADCVISIYAMVVVTSRASRSYCIGYRNADEEILIAETFVRDEVAKFEYNVVGAIHGEYFCTDGNSKLLSDKGVQSSGYFLEQPLKLNDC